jgi:hypothetical protein
MDMAQLVEWELTEENEVLWENLHHTIFSTANPTRSDLWLNSGRRGEKPATHLILKLSYSMHLYSFNDAATNWHYTRLKWLDDSAQWIGKGVEETGRGLI